MKKRRCTLWRGVKIASGALVAAAAGVFLHSLLDSGSAPLPRAGDSASKADISASVETLPPVSPAPALVLSADAVEQGDALAVKVTNIAAGTPSGTFAGGTLAFFRYGADAVAVVGIPVRQKAGVYPLSVVLAPNETLSGEVTVGERKFPVTELKTTPELVEQGHTPVAISQNVAAENAQLKAVFISGPEARFTQPFVYPLDRIEVVGAFGNIRTSNGIAIRHMGVDLEAVEGTPVRAVNDGAVRLAKKFTDYGNTLLVDHGAHVFSLYLHLSEFRVKAGDMVRRGETIALSGNTGYSLAPHLHFSANVAGVSVDSLRFIEAVNAVLSSGVR